MKHRVVGRDEWMLARKKLLAQEKEFTRFRDELNRARRDLPWVAVEKEYSFETPAGQRPLADLFRGRSQLVVYHFMFAPDWDAGCTHCSFWADNFDGLEVHLHQRDVAFVAISRAPLHKLLSYRTRMGWTFPWVSSGATGFNFDFGVSFTEEEQSARKAFYNYVVQDPEASDREGISVFYRADDGSIFHTYSTFARGIDLQNTVYNFLDLVPKGRDENGEGQNWVRRHDEYAK